jgi:O-antigen ligase
MRFTCAAQCDIFSVMAFNRRNLDWWCGRGILSLLLAMLVFGPLAFGGIYPWAFLVLQGLAAGIFALWAAQVWISPRPKLLWPPLAWAVLAFVLYALIRYWTADIEFVARLELIQVLLFGLVFFAVVNQLHGQDETLVITWTLVAVGTAIACYALVQFGTHSDHVWNLVTGCTTRASGTYISPNKLAGLLEMLLPLALAFLLVGRVGIVTRILLGYAALALALGLTVTFSRGGWVAASAGVLVLLGTLLGHRNHRWHALALLLALLAVGGFFVSRYLSKSVGYMQRVAAPDTQELTLPETDARLEMWRAAAEMWGDHFWWGVGPAHYDYRFREYRPENFRQRPDRAHNDYLNLLADWGVAGGIIVFGGAGLFLVGLRKTWPHVRRAENDFGSGQSNRFAFFLGASCGLFALAVHSAVDFNLHMPANALVGVTLLALVAGNLRFATEQYWHRAGWPLKLALTFVLGGLTVYLTAQGWRRAHEISWLARAETLPIFSAERAAALEKAFACESQNAQTAYDIGECYRIQSFDGGENYVALAHQALGWYDRSRRLNPHDGYAFLRTGMCLDWIGQHTQAGPFFAAAEVRDPNGYYMTANIGWHFVQIGDYSAAQQWFERSLRLDNQNEIAGNYLKICQPKLMEQASGQRRLPPDFGGKGH